MSQVWRPGSTVHLLGPPASLALVFGLVPPPPTDYWSNGSDRWVGVAVVGLGSPLLFALGSALARDPLVALALSAAVQCSIQSVTGGAYDGPNERYQMFAWTLSLLAILLWCARRRAGGSDRS